MSTLRVEVVEIKDIQKHPNADRLELAQIFGWTCIVQKGEFKVSSKALYIPIDSLLPVEIESKIFPIDSKIKLSKSRVKTIKIRGAISQGLVVSLNLLGLENEELGTDVAEKLGITKFEPPEKPVHMRGNQVPKKRLNPFFYKYTDIENFKNYPNVFQDGEEVFITEKVHGSNFRCGYVPTEANSLWRKLLRWLKILPKYEFVYGSRNVQLQYKWLWNGFYDQNIYLKIAKQYNLDKVLKPGEVLYGEIYGWGIQKGYTYGCKEGEHKLVVFDIMRINEHGFGNYLSWNEFDDWMDKHGELNRVPLVYNGIFSKDIFIKCSKGGSCLYPEQKIREGSVVKPLIESVCYMGRKVLKYVNDEYLLDEQTDFH